MSSMSRTYASLCLYGDDLDPQALTQLLGVSPSRSGRRGDPLRGNRSVSKGYWILSTREMADECLRDSSAHIRLLAAWPGLNQPALENLHDTCLIRVFVYWELQDGNGGPVLMPDAVSWLVQIGAELHIDLYESAPE